MEVINDTNGELVNFYEVLQREFSVLEREIEISLHSRRQYHKAQIIYDNPEVFTRIQRAWAVWMLANGSYGSKMDGAFGYDRTGNVSKREFDGIEDPPTQILYNWHAKTITGK